MASPNTPKSTSGSTAGKAKAAASSTADDAKKAASDVADTAKDAASDLAQQAKSEAKDLAQQAKSKAADRASEQKEKATGVLSDVATALHDTSDSLRDQDQDAFARYADQAADQVEQFTSAVRDRSVGEILDEAERFARRDPGLFVGGAFLLGIFGARFLKASDDGPSGSTSRSSSRMSGAGRSMPSRTTGTTGRTTGDPFPTGSGRPMDRALSTPLVPGSTGTAGASSAGTSTTGTGRTTS
ncbi:hypothetical protein [Rubrivirga litoralis]|uniref:Uncharacterized protein n=1 Tax=Rubrivirga litoralis TaxID=3075598 RepID=A0ABU3BMS2_9BACT|nr:hypothetical protein [Rubrivirga sp. F394]MDT0630581.1 hypothetical protein [Rubrivirga sp. F394]